MKKIILLCSIVLMSYCASAQLARVFFFSGGFSFLTDAYMSTTNLKPDNTNQKVLTAEESFQYFQWNFFSGILSARMMLVPFTVNSLFRFSALPALIS